MKKILLVVAVLAALAGVYVTTREPAPVGPPCRVVIGLDSVSLTKEQAQNATTIAVVGKRMGMPNHAVTIAFATALQESKLYNLDYGDRDSLGLFQQRPSQGWGSAEQIQDPAFAAQAFYQRLARLRNWNEMSVNDAAQSVQRSGFPYAYEQWETQARTMARAMTGEVAAAFTCRADIDESTVLSPEFASQLSAQAGDPGLGEVVPEQRGWLLASWSIAHSERYGIRSVSFNGQKWTSDSGQWAAGGEPSLTVSVRGDQ